jgi:Tol biopolymer transport system component
MVLSKLNLKKWFSLITIFFFSIALVACVNKEVEEEARVLLEEAKTSLVIADMSNIVSNIDFSTEGRNDVTITWVSDKPEYISSTGIVTRPSFSVGDQMVKVRATMTIQFTAGKKTLTITDTKEFTLCVRALPDNLVPELTYSFVPSYNSGHMFDIYEVNQDGSKHGLLLEATTIGFNQPDWSPDGTVMAIWGWHSEWTISIYTYDTKTEVLTRLTNQLGVYDMFPHWNASGDKIVFTRQYLLENDRNEIWIMNADGSDTKKVVDGYAASWSPDGQQLVFSQVTEGNEDLYICNSDGTNIVKLLDSPSNESFPMWSPNGQFIMFQQFHSPEGETDIDSFEICVLNLLTDEVIALTNNDYMDSAARWSPDGTKIAFLSHANGGSEIYVMNADGSEVKKVTTTNEGSFATFPSWRPSIEP